MKTTLKKIIWVLIGVVVIIAIVYPRIKNSDPAGKEKGPGGGRNRATVVRVIHVKPEMLREIIKSSGTLISDEEVDLSFEASGKIEAIHFTEGVQVKKGQLLAKLNDDDLVAQLNKLKIQEKLAREKENRQKILLTKEAISQESYDQVATDLQSIEADIKLINARIANTEIYAPFDGTIGLRYISEGAYATPSTRIARLVKMQPLKIDFAIPEKYSTFIKPGFKLSFHLDGDTNTYKASVYAVEPRVETNTRTIAVRAVYDNKNNLLRPGKFISVELTIREKKDAIQVPSESIVPELGSEKVFLVENGKAKSVTVTTGMRTERSIEIIHGVNPGDSVVVSGILQLRNDMPVRIDKEETGKKRGKQ